MHRRTSSLVLVSLVTSLLAACGSSASSEASGADEHAGGEAHPHHHGHHVHHAHHDFGDAAQWAQVFDAPDRDEWQRPDEVVALLELAPGAVVADLGAGTGYFEPRLSRAVGPDGRVLALDVEASMVDYLRERMTRESITNVEARVVPLDDPALAPASVDRVLVVDTWHHVTERVAYARRLASALRPGGAIVIVDFTMQSPMGPPPEERIAPDAMLAELTAAGLCAAIVEGESLPHQYVVRATACP